MPFVFSADATRALPAAELIIEDRRNNPVRNRDTLFRLRQRNLLAYTFSDLVPGFGQPGINSLPFRQVLDQTGENALKEGQLIFGSDFVLTSEQRAKVRGDVFQELEAAILWNAAARWNGLMVGLPWEAQPRYPRPSTASRPNRQVAVLNLPRGYDWVRLLVPAAKKVVTDVRAKLAEHGLSLPTSTPDLLVVALPAEYRDVDLYRTPVPNLGHPAQDRIDRAYLAMEDRIEAGEFLLAIAVKASLRSDRLYQPLYEANVMQLLLEGDLGAPQVDFEVHTLTSIGTRAKTIYSAASLGAVATQHARPHRAVRDLYEPPTASDLAKRLLAFLEVRMAQVND